MNCDDLLELVASGEKDVESLPEFIEHLKTCARCRDGPALLAVVRALHTAPMAVLSGHPSADQIVALAMDPEAAALDVNLPVAEHLKVCATCAAELQEVRRAEQKRHSYEHADGARVPFRAIGSALAHLARGPIPARVALATSLGVLLLAYPAFLGLRQLPGVKGQMGDLEVRTKQLEAQIRDLSTSLAQANEASSRLSHWTGPVRLFALMSPVRGQAPKQEIHVGPADPYILVSLRPILSEPSADADVYRITIASQDGRVAWTSEMTVGEMRQQMRSSGALIFPIPSSQLTLGEYELRVLATKDPQEPILQIPFEIVPSG